MRNPAATLFIFAVCGIAFAGEGDPRVTHIGPVSPDVLAITIDVGHAEYGVQKPYEAREDDSIYEQDVHRWIRRDGKVIGSLVGTEGDIMYTFDTLTGRPLDADWADRPGSYTIASGSDSGSAAGMSPEAVYRKTKPTDLVRTAFDALEPTFRHILYLKFDKPFETGVSYNLAFNGSDLPDQTFLYDPLNMRSEAVHVTHVGFRPKDAPKVAFLSCWMGSGGPVAYEPGLDFQVLEDKTGEPVFTGRTVLSKAATDADEDSFNKNYNGADVFIMDFTPLDKPGTYRIHVDGVGCSYPFDIAGDAWREAFIVAARGFYHQRSGIPIGPPYSEYTRPRPFHPDDGMKIYASTATLINTGNGIDHTRNNFAALVKGKTDEIVPNAWGALMDAGDWDRRIQHLDASRALLDLALTFPAYFATVSLNIPESENELPDIVDEALFNLDGYRRLQTPEGGVRGGIESAEHPRYGETSWQESLPVMAYAPGVWSSHMYAGVAARAAYWFEKHHPQGAEVYRDSALRAMEWAEKKIAEGDFEKEHEYTPQGINDMRNLAAAELYRLTGDDKWNALFLETTGLKEDGAPVANYGASKPYAQHYAAAVYALTDRPGVDKTVQTLCRDALIREADMHLQAQAKTGFRWIKHPARPPIGTFSTSLECAIYVIPAHQLTGDGKYLRAAVLTCQTHTGANPLNLCYTTGLGHDFPRNPLHVEWRITNQDPPPGLPIVGPVDWAHLGGINQVAARHCYPPGDEWPVIENFRDIYWCPIMCEYTVHQFMAPTSYVWGYLAASDR